MNRALLSMAAMVAYALAAGNANADLIFSTSATDALAGSTLNMSEGGTGSLYIWVSGNAGGNNLIGLAFSVEESEGTIVDATAHLVQDPANRWVLPNAGTINDSGDLIHDAATAAIPIFGIVSTGPTDYVLHSEIQLTATAGGTTMLNFAPHTNPGNGITFRGVIGNQFAVTTKGTATVTVDTAQVGDANGDGNFDFGDIEAFYLSVTDPTAYAAQYPNVAVSLLDLNEDGSTNEDDIEAFFMALVN